MDKQKIPFDYNIMTNIDLIINPNAFRNYVLNELIECEACHHLIKRKFLNYCITWMCRCGIGILYPKIPRWTSKSGLELSSYLYKFVPFKKESHPEWEKEDGDKNAK